MKRYITRFIQWLAPTTITGTDHTIKEVVCPIKQLMTITPTLIDACVTRTSNNSTIISRKALLNHESDVIQIASIVLNHPNINRVLKQKEFPYRFYTMDKLHNYFTCKQVDGIIEIYLSKTFKQH